MAEKVFGADDQGQSVEAKASATGFHSFMITARDTPETNRKPAYELKVSYQAPESLDSH